jgi:DNA polymerase-4
MTRHGLAARTATVKLRFADFKTVTRSRSVGWGEVRDTDTLLGLARSLTFESDRPKLPIRLLGVAVSHLGGLGTGQQQAQARLDFG